LKEYQNKNPKFKFYVNANPTSKFRTHNIAIARNFCLNFIRNNKATYPYFIMMDFDDVNCKEVNINTLGKYLKREDWVCLSIRRRHITTFGDFLFIHIVSAIITLMTITIITESSKNI
jgi:hypothetical protein